MVLTLHSLRHKIAPLYLANRVNLVFMSVLAMGALDIGSGAHASDARTLSSLTVFVGPQSVIPNEPIYVTVEVQDRAGNSANNHKVTLYFQDNGQDKALLGKTLNGLVSFEVPGQTKAGLMVFKADIGTSRSKDAMVIVSAAQPSQFSLSVEPALNAGALIVSSAMITDAFNNQLSDLSLVTIDWLDARGLKKTHKVQLATGRIMFTGLCPKDFRPPLKIRATLKNVRAESMDVSSLCADTAGL